MGYNEIKNISKKILKTTLWTAGIVGGIGIITLVFAIITFSVWYFENKPSKNKFDRHIEWEYFWEKDKNGECIIDLAETMNFEWDSLIHCHPTHEMKAQGICSSEYKNIRFMRNGNVVYYAEWHPYYSENAPGGIVFKYEGDILTVYPHDAKFKAYKDNSLDHEYYSKYIILEKVGK